MARVRRPEVPAGPIRVFFDRVHSLHEAAGQPSMREIQRRTRGERRPSGINPTTIHDVFAAPRVARWEVVESVVTHLGGDVEEFAELWRRARHAETQLPTETETQPRPPVSGVAQLPLDAFGFTGRADEIGRLDAILAAADNQPTAVLISAVSGTAGVGKTTLAVHWAHRVADRFPDGQLYLNLRGFEPSGAAVPPAEAVRGFLDALGVPGGRIPAGLAAQTALYRSVLTGRRVLVVLDNARDAEQVRPLLPGAPGCLAMVTSRNRLTGLIATEGAHPIGLDLLSAAESRDLLARRLGADRLLAEPGAVDEIIEHCARLPLALSIVAARAATSRACSLAMLAAELRDAQSGLDAFSGADVATDLRAVFSWSYRTLGSEAARLFRLLGSHPGPDFGLPAAASLAGLAVPAARQALAELLDAHLVTEHAPGRYGLHDLLRAYAAEQSRLVDAASSCSAAGRRVIGHYLYTAYAAYGLLNPQRDPIALAPLPEGVTPEPLGGLDEALAWFGAERHVLRAVLEASSDSSVYVWQLAQAMRTYLVRRGLLPDQLEVAGAGLSAALEAGDGIAAAHAHHAIAIAQVGLGNHDRARAPMREALGLFQVAGDLAGQALVHRGIARSAARQGRFQAALEHSEQALALYQAAGHEVGIGTTLNAVGWFHARLGDYEQALTYCRDALSRHQKAADLDDEAADLDSLGYIHMHLGEYLEAVQCYERALELFHDQGYTYQEADTYLNLGDAHLHANDPAAARQAWQRALDLLESIDDFRSADARKRLDGLQG